MMGVVTVACMVGHLSHMARDAPAALAPARADWPSHTLPFMAVYLVMVGVHALFMALTDPHVSDDGAWLARLGCHRGTPMGCRPAGGASGAWLHSIVELPHMQHGTYSARASHGGSA